MGMGSYGLLHNNEGLYAQIAWEMLETNSFVLPRLNGGLYLEKPPLLYWMMACSFHLFGHTEFAARLVPSLAGFATVSMVYGWLRWRINHHTALIGAMVLSSSALFMMGARMVFFDMVLTCFITASLFCFYKAWVENQPFYIKGFYSFLALALLTKGFVSLILMVSCLVSYAVLQRQHKRLITLLWDKIGILIFLLIALPWHLMAWYQEPDFGWFYIVNEHVLRFLDLRVPKDYYRGPFYYYLPRLGLGFLPWSIVAWGFFAIKKEEILAPHKDLLKFSLCWIGSFLLFFSFSKAKANYYILTLMPAGAIIFSVVISYLKSDFWVKWLCGLMTIVFPLLVLILFLFPHLIKPQYQALTQMIPLMELFVWGGGTVLVLCWLRKKIVLVYCLMLSLQVGVLLSLAVRHVSFFEDTFSGKQIAKLVPFTAEHVYFYKDYEKISSVRFYLKNNVTIIDSQSNDLAFAAQKPDSKNQFISSEDFLISHFGQEKWIFVFHEQQKSFESWIPEATLISQQGGIYLYKMINAP